MKDLYLQKMVKSCLYATYPYKIGDFVFLGWQPCQSFYDADMTGPRIVLSEW